MPRTKNFAVAIRAQLASDPELAEKVREESLNAHIAQQVYDLRSASGLTQKELADLVGTQQSVISRIEDDNYDGHSLGLLRRIAEATNKILHVAFLDAKDHGGVKVAQSIGKQKRLERKPSQRGGPSVSNSPSGDSSGTVVSDSRGLATAEVTREQLHAYLDDILPDGDVAKIEQLLRSSEPLRNLLREVLHSREVERALADPSQRRHVLTKGSLILGMWKSLQEAHAKGLTRLLSEELRIHQIRAEEPVLTVGRRKRCRN